MNQLLINRSKGTDKITGDRHLVYSKDKNSLMKAIGIEMDDTFFKKAECVSKSTPSL
jgi:hypothetical protein